MIVLAIDTCGPSGTAALGRAEAGSVVLLTQTELPGKTYSAQLVPAIRAMLAEQGIDATTLDAVLAVNGPGSFTGIRVGVSTAKGFAEALSIPLAAVSRLAVLAAKAGAQTAVLDAGRNQLYFREGERETLIASKDLVSNPPTALAVCEPAVHWSFPDAILTTPPTAADALSFAAPHLLAGEFADTASLEGNYVRRSDAEIFAKAPGKS